MADYGLFGLFISNVNVTTLFGLLWPTFLLAICIKVLVSVVRLFQKRWQLEKELACFPSLDVPRHWLLGNLSTIKNNEDTYAVFPSLVKDIGPVFILWCGPFLPRLICRHPSSIKTLTATTEPKEELVYGFLRPWLGDGLLVSSGPKWFRNRRLLTPGFHFDILKPYVKIFNECVHTMANKWESVCRSAPDGVVLEMFEDVSLMTLDTLLKCIFGQDSHCQTQRERNPYIKSVYTLSALVIERARFPPYFNDFIYYISPSGFRFRRAAKILHNYSSKVIQDRKMAMKMEEKSGIKRTKNYIDFLDILLNARDENGQGLEDKEIRDEVDTFMFEGHDTTASGISWIFYNLASHPEHQEKCRREIDDILDKKDTDEIEWDDLRRIPYTTMCIKESLRIRPPVPGFSRQLTSPLNFDGRIAPAGSFVSGSAFLVHHNADVWPNPTKYDPLRFLPENTRDRSPHAFIPFSAGPRNCIGQNFAMNEMKVATCIVLRHFQLTVDKQRPPRRVNNLVSRSESGIHLNIKKRN
ncbi:ultra-long-chain fatty acid omega-hydroxylase-like [Saccoglossus kowalevskii]|uniref:Cytochrome P450 4F22-like n=1 Tax=Saccoglossus kowalevskii TaxID=10224 RepID=A0ABM0GRS6_SACKO|nr:PREDICTED: cytochrome P450 4F22-like [Saccoglossus kowalevskii]